MVRSKDEILASIHSRIGEDNSDEAIALVEDINDTFDDLSTKAASTVDWEKKYNAANATDYMVKNNVLVVSPSVSVSLPSDSADISVIRNSVNHSVCDASWRMIFAADDKAFDKMWDDMVTELKGFGFDDLYKFDVEKHTIEVNAKLAALK